MADNTSLRKEAGKTTKDIEGLLKHMKTHRQSKQRTQQPTLKQQQKVIPTRKVQFLEKQEQSQGNETVQKQMNSIKNSLGIIHHSEDLQENLIMVKKQLEKLLSERDSNQVKLHDLSEEINKQQTIIKNLDVAQAQNKHIIQTVNEAIATLQDNREKQQQKTKQLEHQIKLITERETQTSKELKDTKFQFDIVKNEMERLLKQQIIAKQFSKAVTEKYHTEITRLNELNQSTRQEYGKKIAELEGQILNKQRQIAELKNYELQNQIKEQIIKSLKAQLEIMKDCNSGLSTEVQIAREKTRQLISIEQATKENIKKINSLQQQALKQNELLRSCEQREKAYINELKSLKKQVGQKEDQTKLLKRARSVEQDLTRRLEDMVGLNSAYEQLKEEHEHISEQLPKLNSQLLKINADLTNVNKEFQQSKLTCIKKDEQINELKGLIESQKMKSQINRKELLAKLEVQTCRLETGELVVKQLRSLLQTKTGQHSHSEQTNNEQNIRVEKKESERSYQSDTTQNVKHKIKSSDQQPSDPTADTKYVNDKKISDQLKAEQQILNQLITIETLNKKLESNEIRLQQQIKGFHKALNEIKQQHKRQKEGLRKENTELKQLTAKLSVLELKNMDPEGETFQKLKILAQSLKHLHTIADQEEMTKNELVEKVMTLIKAVGKLKQRIRQMQLQHADMMTQSSTFPIKCQLSILSQSKAQKPHIKKKVMLNLSNDEVHSARLQPQSWLNQASIQTDPILGSFLQGQNGQPLVRRVQSVLVKQSNNVDKIDCEQQINLCVIPATMDYQLQTDSLEYVNQQQQTLDILNYIQNNSQQTKTHKTNQINLQTNIQHTHSQQQQNTQPLAQIKITTNTQLQTENITVKQLNQVSLQTECQPEKCLSNNELQTDRIMIAQTPTQTIETLESMKNESVNNNLRVKQLEDTIQTNSQHYIKLVEALNEQIAFLKDSSPTDQN